MNNDRMFLACATNDGTSYINDHFGDSKFFKIYEISKEGYKFVKTIENKSPQEKQHADPKKAKSIAGILKEHSVKVLASKAFGGNIVRMKRQFVCIKCNKLDIEKSLEVIIKNFDRVVTEWGRGEDRDFMLL